MRRSLGREFRWLWTAFAVSTVGTWLAFNAFPLIALRVLHAGPPEVSALAAVGMAVGAAVAVPLGPWVEFRRKRPVMVAMDLVRFAAMLSIPAAYALGLLTFVQLLVVSIVVSACDIAFRAASGANLKAVVRPEDLLVANGRFESTTWTATMIGPPLGGAAIGLLGPVTTVVADAVSYLLSALGIRAMGGDEPPPARREAARPRARDLFDGWRYILTHAELRSLFLNSSLVGGLILATEPLLTVLMVDRLGFPLWQYGLAFAVPCTAGLVGSRLSRRIVARYGRRRVVRVAGTLGACWPVGLAFIGPGVAGLALVMVVEFGLITCLSVYNPVLATRRLELAPTDRVARVLSAWTVTKNATIAALTALWGLLAGLTGPRVAIGIAGVLLLATPLLLPRREGSLGRSSDSAPAEPALASVASRDAGPAPTRGDTDDPGGSA
ncbi:MFS transporter [Actinoallomurus iriomotensis]|uniref:MFS transporter n=1 Tax=Actinoallomurus iriomotensis TaxID=478107 RepID=A0A9W6S377_9ACTN|nr:MFS transporter [Actinoallomurus iriomotensis]GLY86584.1 MFS transporter [Actinoallomurus iriomotensis]